MTFKPLFLLLLFFAFSTAMAEEVKLKRSRISDNYALISDLSAKDKAHLKRHMIGVFKAFKKELKFRSVAGRWDIRFYSDKEDYYAFIEKNGLGTKESFINNPAFFDAQNRELCCRKDRSIIPSLRHMTHESFHQFLDYFWQNAPRWLHEGYAVHYENGLVTEKGFITKTDIVRWNYVMKHKKAGDLPSLKELMQCTDVENFALQGETGFYAMSYCFVQYLLKGKKGTLKKKMDAWIKLCMMGRDTQKSFDKIFKLSVSELETGWHEWMQDQTIDEAQVWADAAFINLVGSGRYTYAREMDRERKDIFVEVKKILKENPGYDYKRILSHTADSLKEEKIDQQEFVTMSSAWVLFILQYEEGDFIMDEILKNLSSGHDTIDCLNHHLGSSYKKLEKRFINFLKKRSR